MIKRLFVFMAAMLLFYGTANATIYVPNFGTTGPQSFTYTFDSDFTGNVSIGVANVHDTALDSTIDLSNFGGLLAGTSNVELSNNGTDMSAFVNTEGFSGTSGEFLSQQVTAMTGDTITFDWNFTAGDYYPFSDFAFVQIDNGHYDVLAEIRNLVGNTPENPVLPEVQNPGEFVFQNPNPGLWFDPPYADGFDYSLSAGAFLSVGLPPTLFPGVLDIPYGSVDLVIGGSTVASLLPGGSHTFGPGVTAFSIMGIAPLLDMAHPSFGNAFPTLLDFTVVPGQTLLMTAHTASVPEPASILLVGAGLAGLAFYRRSGRVLY